MLPGSWHHHCQEVKRTTGRSIFLFRKVHPLTLSLWFCMPDPILYLIILFRCFLVYQVLYLVMRSLHSSPALLTQIPNSRLQTLDSPSRPNGYPDSQTRLNLHVPSTLLFGASRFVGDSHAHVPPPADLRTLHGNPIINYALQLDEKSYSPASTHRLAFAPSNSGSHQCGRPQRTRRAQAHHLCIRIHANMRSNAGSSSTQYSFRRSALRRSLMTC